jgi:hypothetical protein
VVTMMTELIKRTGLIMFYFSLWLYGCNSNDNGAVPTCSVEHISDFPVE